jgi:hypothetical protein
VQDSRSLTRVFCCSHLADPELLLFVSEVLMVNRRIALIRLDLNSFYDYSAFHKAFRRWQDRGVALAYPWPKPELDVICARNPALAAELPALRALHDVVVKGNPAVFIPPETVLRVETPSEPSEPRTSSFFSSQNSRIAGIPRPFAVHSSPPPFNVTGPPSPPRSDSAGEIPAIYKAEPRLPAERTLEFTDVDPINLTEDAEYLLPVPPLPPLVNSFVPDLFDTEFDLEEVMKAVRLS